jgi:hypothetical protein
LYVFILSMASVANPLSRAPNANAPRLAAVTVATVDESPTLHARRIPTPVAKALPRARVAIVIAYTASTTPDERTNPEDAVARVVVSTPARADAAPPTEASNARVTARRAARRNMFVPSPSPSGAVRCVVQ